MWAGGSEVNKDGTSVLLLQPKSKRPTKSTNQNKKDGYGDPCASFLGGTPVFFNNSSSNGDGYNDNVRPKCDICRREMHLILQLYAPLDGLDRSLMVFGCNDAVCFQSTFSSSSNTTGSTCSTSGINRFCLGGKGAVKCLRSQFQQKKKIDIVSEENKNKNKNIPSCSSDNTTHMDQEEKKNENNIPSKDGAVASAPAAASTWDDGDAWDDGGGWGMDDDADGDCGDWGSNDAHVNPTNLEGDDKSTSTNNTTSMEDLEKMLAAMESKNNESTEMEMEKEPPEINIEHEHVPTVKNKPNTSSISSKHMDMDMDMDMNTKQQDKIAQEQDANTFQRYELDVYDEPYLNLPNQQGASTNNREEIDSDDDDVLQVEDGSKEASDIDKLLSKYLKEEEDSDILSAIEYGARGGSRASGGNGGGGGGGGALSGEKYERAPPEERCFLAFTNRIKRAPKQSVRYAYGGIPLWSIPTPLTTKGKRGIQTRDLNFPTIPPCPCGSHREFEFQVMPSILHVLKVDQCYRDRHERTKHENHAMALISNEGRTRTRTSKMSEMSEMMSKSHGGMNWGTIVVYSCAISCESEHNEFVIIQESADGNPEIREMKKINDGEEDGDD